MAANVTYEEFSFALDLASEELEALGYDAHTIVKEESPLHTIEQVWNDKAMRQRFPDAIDKVGEADAAVVLARLSFLFGVITANEGEYEGAGFCAPLIVTRAGDVDGEAVAVAAAYDYYGSSRLSVLPLGDDESLAEEIAREFWSLIFDELDALEEAEARVYNPDGGVWISYGVDDKGKMFMTTDEAEPEELEEFEERPFGQDRYEEEEEVIEDDDGMGHKRRKKKGGAERFEDADEE
ncbi:MAG: hypothetical protein NTX50_21150 [Candidatus Sumerlaeota bacterium]|nr:hypothetical protein [Candidatus Sumerlaeota bacterium]